MREFEKLYDLLHIAGYYRALIYDTQVVKDTIKLAEKFIKKSGELTPITKTPDPQLDKIYYSIRAQTY